MSVLLNGSLSRLTSPKVLRKSISLEEQYKCFCVGIHSEMITKHVLGE